MAYEKLMSTGCLVPVGTGVLGVEDLDGAAAVHGEYLVMKRCAIKRIMFNVSEAVVADTTAPVVRFSRRILQGNDTGAVVLGTLTIPHGTAVGKILYKDIEPVVLEPGDTLMLENTQRTVDAGSGTETGQGYFGFEAVEVNEAAENETDMIESA